MMPLRREVLVKPSDMIWKKIFGKVSRSTWVYVWNCVYGSPSFWRAIIDADWRTTLNLDYRKKKV